MNLNYPTLTDDNRESYFKPGAVVETSDGRWLKIAEEVGKPTDFDREFRLSDGMIYVLFTLRPVLPAYESAEQYYAELCEMFELDEYDLCYLGGKMILCAELLIEHVHISLFTDPEDGNLSLAGHGEPPELALWQQRVRVVHSVITEAQHG